MKRNCGRMQAKEEIQRVQQQVQCIDKWKITQYIQYKTQLKQETEKISLQALAIN